MRFCKECGKSVSDNLQFCTNCGSKIEDSVENKQNTTIQTTPKNTKSKASIIICITLALLVLVGILSKDSIMYNYYTIRADKESLASKSVEYYGKALNIKYNQDIVSKIANKIKEDKDFENTLESLSYTLEESDLDKVYSDVYVSKAKENYENKNYETCWTYLDKAELYGYDVLKFEYYNDLIKIKDKEEASENIVLDDTNDEYIISDSSTRYLTENELLKYSNKQLAYIRNEIFARHGYIFEKDEYKQYFLSKSWYVPNPYFSGSEEDLNYIERENIKLIREIEKK